MLRRDFPPPQPRKPVFAADMLAKVTKSVFYNAHTVVEASVRPRDIEF